MFTFFVFTVCLGLVAMASNAIAAYVQTARAYKVGRVTFYVFAVATLALGLVGLGMLAVHTGMFAMAMAPVAKPKPKAGLATKGQSQQVAHAAKVINVIAQCLPKGTQAANSVHTGPMRITLRNTTLLAKGIVASAFCRSGHTQVLLPALGKQLGVKMLDRVGNPLVILPHANWQVGAKKLGQQIAKALTKKYKG